MQRNAPVEFDLYEQNYAEAVNRAVGFSGLGVDFFTRVKVDYFGELLDSLAPSVARAEVVDVGCGVANSHPLPCRPCSFGWLESTSPKPVLRRQRLIIRKMNISFGIEGRRQWANGHVLPEFRWSVILSLRGKPAFDRVLPGGVIVFDDYGWKMFRNQKGAEDDFTRRHDHEILELPTGQGLVIRR